MRSACMAISKPSTPIRSISRKVPGAPRRAVAFNVRVGPALPSLDEDDENEENKENKEINVNACNRVLGNRVLELD